MADLAGVAAMVVSHLPTTPDGLVLLGEVTAALDCAPVAPPGVAGLLEQARVAAVRHWCNREAAHLLSRRAPDREVFIDLIGWRADPPSGAFGPAGQPDTGRVREPSSPMVAVPLIAGMSEAMILGGAGAGKSTVARRVGYLLAGEVISTDPDPDVPPRLPLTVRAATVAARLAQPGPPDPVEVLRVALDLDGTWRAECFVALLTIGAFHITVDDLGEVAPDDRQRVSSWLKELRRRFPRTPAVACQRSFDYRPDLLAFPPVILQKVTPEQARAYIHDELRVRQSQLPAADAARQVNRLFDSEEHHQLRDAIATPLFLWMTVERFAATGEIPRTIGALFNEFTQWNLEERHRVPEGLRVRFSLADKVQLLERLANQLVASGNATELRVSEVGGLFAGADVDVLGMLDEIVASEILHRGGETIRFHHQLFLEYFAAQALERIAETDRAELRERVLGFAWREPTRILLGSASTSPELATFILDTAIDADPRYAAWLLRAAETAPRHVVDRFLDRQRAELFSPLGGEHGWTKAARGLAIYRSPQALAHLDAAARAEALPPVARVAAIDAIVAAWCWSASNLASMPDDPLASLVTDLLSGDDSTDVRARAARAIGDASLVALIGVAWDLVTLGQSWPVVRAAYTALLSLGARITPRVRANYLAACESRLEEVERDLPRTAALPDAAALNDERFLLLHELAAAGRLDVVLMRRFAYGLADRPGWLVMLRDAALCCPADSVAAANAPLLTGDGGETTAELLDMFATGDDLTATAAAHRLLMDGSALPHELLGMVTASSSRAKLLAAAAVVECLGPDDLVPVERLIHDLLTSAGPDSLEPLAALVSAVEGASHTTRVRLAHTTHLALQQRGIEDAMYWPWSSAWYDTALADAEVVQWLDEDPSAEEAAVDAATCFLSCVDFLLDAGGRPPALNLTDPARTRLRAKRPASAEGTEASDFVMAASFAGLREEMPFIQEVAKTPANAGTLVRHAHARYGVLQVSAASHAISAMGYFGRLAYEDGDPATCWKAYAHLSELDTTGEHGSVERARLVGLGLLGDWQAVLSALAPDDPVLLQAAGNLMTWWIPGPCTPTGEGASEVARWIGQHLETADLHPVVRSTLGQIKEDLDLRLKRYVV